MYLIPLRYFQCAAREGNIAQAAEKLHVSPQTLSASIISLEKELGCELFERARGKANTLNAYGRTYLEYVDKMLDLQEKALQALDGVRHQKSNILSLACTGLTFPTRLLAAFRQAHSEYSIQQHLILQDELPDYAGRTDIEIILSALDYENAQLQSETLWSERMYLVVYAGHPLAGRKSVKLSELAQEKFVLMPGQYYWSNTVRRLCERAGFRPKVEAECFPDQYAAMLRQNYVTILSAGSLATSGVQSAPYVSIELEDSFCVRQIRMLRRSGVPLSDAAQTFWEFALDYARNREGE